MRYFFLSLTLIIFFIPFKNITAKEVENEKLDFISFKDKELFPEGITSDDKGNLYISSIKKGKVLKIDAETKKIETFIRSGNNDLISAIGIFADNKNNALYVCSSDPGVSKNSGKAAVALKKYSLKKGKFIKSYDLPGGGFCNDITADSLGNVYVTDSFNPRILRLKKGDSRLKTWVKSNLFAGEGFNLNGIDFLEKNNSIYVNKYNTGKLFKISIRNKSITEIKLPRPLFKTDGMRFLNQNTLLLVEGDSDMNSNKSIAIGGEGRITKVILEKNNTAKLKNFIEGLDVPATITVTDKMIWITESQYDHLYEHTHLTPYPFRIIGKKID